MNEGKKIAVLLILEKGLDRAEPVKEQLLRLRDELAQILETDRIIVLEM